jgi:hypothetical protein
MTYHNHRDFSRAEHVRQAAHRILGVVKTLRPVTTDLGEALQLLDAENAANTALTANLEGLPSLTLNTAAIRVMEFESAMAQLLVARKADGRDPR